MVKILEPILTRTLRATARMAQQAEVGLHVNEMLTRRSTCRALTALWAKSSSASSRTRALRSILTIREYQRPRPRRNDGSLSLALSLKRRGHEIRVKLLLHRMDRTYRPTRRDARPPDSAATEFTIGTVSAGR